jgi:hypothetical protein
MIARHEKGRVKRERGMTHRNTKNKWMTVAYVVQVQLQC